MGTDADCDKQIRFDRTRFVLAVFRLHLLFGFWVADQTVSLFKRFELCVSAVDKPYRLATPFDSHHFAWAELGNIHLNRCACGFSPFRGQHAFNKRRCYNGTTYATDSGCGHQQATSATIYFLITTHEVTSGIKNLKNRMLQLLAIKHDKPHNYTLLIKGFKGPIR
jgi:hypothetical protein